LKFEIQDRKSWYEAEEDCLTWGGHLTSISDENENSFVRGSFTIRTTRLLKVFCELTLLGLVSTMSRWRTSSYTVTRLLLPTRISRKVCEFSLFCLYSPVFPRRAGQRKSQRELRRHGSVGRVGGRLLPRHEAVHLQTMTSGAGSHNSLPYTNQSA
ncbi:hypothetical protein ANCDUO_18749, partial [Ancylostoma duodenale]